MGEQLSEADRALIERVMIKGWGDAHFRTVSDTTMAAIIQAARSEGPHPEQIAENANCSSPGQLLAESASYSGLDQYADAGKMIAASPPLLEGEGSNTDLIAELRLRLVIAKVGGADVIKFDVSDLEAVIAALAAAPVASKGEALPVVSEEMVEAAAHGWLSSAYNATIADNALGEKTLIWRNTIRDARAALTAALSLPKPASDRGEEAPVAWVVFATGECCKGGRKIDISRAEVEQYGREIYGKFDVQPLYARPVPGVSREEVSPLPREQSLLDALMTIRDDYRVNHTSKFAHGIAAGALEVHGTWFAALSRREGE